MYALVTGGAQRIGRAIVSELAVRGYAVAVHYRSAGEEAQSLVRDINAAGGRAIAICADLTRQGACEALVDHVWSASEGKLSLVVNSAAIFEADGEGGLDVPGALKHFELNALAPAEISAAFFRKAERSQSSGAVVNLIDQRIMKHPSGQYIGYSMSKHALYAATMAQAKLFAPTLRINAISPGLTLPSGPLQGDEFFLACKSNPMGRCPSPEEIARAVLFMAESPALCGAMLPVDCGERFIQGAI
ncbi:MAG: SDR family oxidoreductase [Anaerolineae bacterium]|nr:SDR family oxidoreductase [Anaerolineae bacterium]MCL4722750.1 SDR family oxidoreductase [Rhodocyclaceae bacterium]GIK44771.1 MAG: short chain dehydrogenase [Betaproteobacteria bacterium]